VKRTEILFPVHCTHPHAPLLGWQLHCRPNKMRRIPGWQYNCHPNKSTPNTNAARRLTLACRACRLQFSPAVAATFDMPAGPSRIKGWNVLPYGGAQ
jgi:hypothetical protein